MDEVATQAGRSASGAASGAVLVVALCFAAAMCEGFDVQAAGVAAAGVSHDFHPSPGQLGLFFAAANLGLVFGALIGGPLADRIGRKPVLVASMLAFAACSLLNGLAPNAEALTAARLATGLGLGGAMPNMIALVTDVTTARARNAVIAIAYVGMPVGGSLASVLVLALGPDHWRQVFFAGGLAPLVVAAALALWLREARSQAAAAAPRAGPFTAILTEGRLARTLAIWAGFFAAALMLHLMLNWLPLLLQGRGLSKADAALAQAAFNLLGAAGALLAGMSLDTRARGAGVAVSLAAIPAALLLVATGPALAAGTALSAGLLGAGVLALNVILYGAAGDCYPAAIRGAGMGAAVGATRLGALAGPTLAAALLSAGRSPGEVLVSLLPMVLAGGLCAAWLTWLKLAGRVEAVA